MNARLGSVLAAGLTALAPVMGHAQLRPVDRSAAIALYDHAEELLNRGEIAEACPKFAESYRLDPQLGALLHLADCYEKNGQLASAWASFRDAIEIAKKKRDAREQVARQRAADLAPKLSKLVIRVPEQSDMKGLVVLKDGARVHRSTWGTPLPVDAGAHVIEAAAPGRQKLRAKVTVANGAGVTTFELPLLSDDGMRPRAAVQPTPQRQPTQPSVPKPDTAAPTTQRTLGWIAGGLGAIGLGAGLVFEMQRSSSAEERDGICPSGKNCTVDERNRVNKLNEDVDAAAKLEGVSFGAGGLLLVGGAILLLTAPSEADAAAAGVQLVPMASARQAGALAVGRW